MGRTLPVFLVRAAVLLGAGLLLFAVLGNARAASYAGDDYGLAPLPPASPSAAASATTYNGTSGFMPAPNGLSASGPAPSSPTYGGDPTSGGFAPAPSQNRQPQASAAPTPLAPQSGFTPAPGYRTAANNTAPYQPAPVYQAPVYRAPVYQAPLAPAQPAASDYGFKPDMRGSAMPAPVQASAHSSSSAPYGYNSGDGEPKADVITPMPGGPTPYYQPPFQAADNSPRVNPDYVLGTGDKIHLSVFDEADLSGDYTVDGSGYVRLPLIGQVRAAGYTPPQLEAAVGSALANGYLRSPRVSIEVVTYRPFYVIGAVGRPGEFPYVNHMTVLNAVAMAGGFLPSAVESEVYIRPQGSTQEYAARADTATQIHPGDVVRVKTTLFWDTMSLFAPLNGVAAIAAGGVRY